MTGERSACSLVPSCSSSCVAYPSMESMFSLRRRSNLSIFPCAKHNVKCSSEMIIVRQLALAFLRQCAKKIALRVRRRSPRNTAWIPYWCIHRVPLEKGRRNDGGAMKWDVHILCTEVITYKRSYREHNREGKSIEMLRGAHVIASIGTKELTQQKRLNTDKYFSNQNSLIWNIFIVNFLRSSRTYLLHI